LHRGEEQRDENADDRNHDQQFDERERFAFSLAHCPTRLSSSQAELVAGQLNKREGDAGARLSFEEHQVNLPMICPPCYRALNTTVNSA
jgi:hypothetical protein